MATREDWPCYYDAVVDEATVKTGRQLDERDLEALAVLYQELVAGDLFSRDWGGVVQREVVVQFATQDEFNITPSDDFLRRISADSLVTLASGDLWSITRCELRLWAWVGSDSAQVEATLTRGAAGVSRSALVVHTANGWNVCPSRSIAFVN